MHIKQVANKHEYINYIGISHAKLIIMYLTLVFMYFMCNNMSDALLKELVMWIQLIKKIILAEI